MAMLCGGDIDERAAFIHSLFDLHNKGTLSEDELSLVFETLSDTMDRLGVFPLASQNDLDDMVVEATTAFDGSHR